MTTRSWPVSSDTDPPLRRSGMVVGTIRPAAGWMRTSTPGPRPISSQPVLAPSSGWPSRVVVTDVAGDGVVTGSQGCGAGCDAVLATAVARFAGGLVRRWLTAPTAPATTSVATVRVNHLGQGSRGGASPAES